MTILKYLNAVLTSSLLALSAQCVLAAEQVKIGVTAGPSAEILEAAVPIAKKAGLDVKVIEFQDYIRPNSALNDGDLQANIYQTIPFLETQNRDRGYKHVAVGKAFTLPMAFYSKKIKSFDEAPDGATVGIPNDAAMGGRALVLLAANNIIKLKDGVGLFPTPLDIIENPKHLKFVELEAATLPRALDDLTISAINGNYAAVAGLNPTHDGIIREDSEGPYVCNIVVRASDKDKPWVKKFVQAYQSPGVRSFIAKKYDGSVIPGF